jgi:hypothetical protein
MSTPTPTGRDADTPRARAIRIGPWLVPLILIVVLCLEFSVRFDDWARFGTPLSSGNARMGDLLVADANGIQGRPGAAYRQYAIDADGYRAPLTARRDTAGAAVVMALGASETFGLYESADMDWPRQLERQLATTCASAPIVLNGAFAGMSLPTVTAWALPRAARRRPKVVVYYPTPMQYVEASRLPQAFDPRTMATPPAPKWWNPRAQWRVRDAVKGAVPSPVLDLMRRLDVQQQRDKAGITTFTQFPIERLDAFDADLRRFAGAVRATGAQLVLVPHQHRFRDTTDVAERRWLRAWERFYPLASGATLLEFDQRARERILAVARDSGAMIADPSASLAAIGPRAFADFSHFTDDGAAAMATSISAAVAPALGCPVSVEPPR